MNNRYSAQHVSAYIIFELQDHSIRLNQRSLQKLLKQVDQIWRKVFKTCAFKESVYAHSDIYIKEVFDVYTEQFGNGPIQEPAREWYLPYGQFQLHYRPYGIPPYSPLEKTVMKKILSDYIQIEHSKAS